MGLDIFSAFEKKQVADDVLAPALDRASERTRQIEGFRADLRARGLRGEWESRRNVVHVRDGRGRGVCDVSVEEVCAISTEEQASVLVERCVRAAGDVASRAAMDGFGARRLLGTSSDEFSRAPMTGELQDDTAEGVVRGFGAGSAPYAPPRAAPRYEAPPEGRAPAVLGGGEAV